MQIEFITAPPVVQKAAPPAPVGPISAVATGESRPPLDTRPESRPSDSPDPSRPISETEVEEALRSVDEAMKDSNVSLKFSRDEETGTMVVEMVDRNSGETLRQLPSEASLHLAATLGKLQGLVFDRKA